MNKKLSKFSNYVLLIVFISIFLELKFPVMHWVSLIGMVVLYAMNLVKEKLRKGRIHPASIVLCFMAISWLVLRPYVKSGYVAIYGQLVIYGYLIYTQWQRFRTSSKILCCLCCRSGKCKFSFPKVSRNSNFHISTGYAGMDYLSIFRSDFI